MPSIHWIGLNQDNVAKLALSAALFFSVFIIRRIARVGLKLFAPGETKAAIVRRFWGHQAINVGTLVIAAFALASIWFDDPARLATAFGLVGAGLAFALQRVITAFAGYVIILRGNNFTVGARISMGGVRGDVIALGFIQTTIMEMGQPPAVQSADPAVWVKSRQFTGRIVTVANAKIFDEPIYNYTRDFPYIWDEITLPIAYSDDRDRAEAILLEAATTNALTSEKVGHTEIDRLRRTYGLDGLDLDPAVYWRITDNWLELTVRFVANAHGIRTLKDKMSREILRALDAAGIGIASATYDIVGLPPIRLAQPAAKD